MTTQMKDWTIRDLMRTTIALLDKKGVPESRLSVELLLAHALGLPRIRLYMDFEKPVLPEELDIFRTLMNRRIKREPVQYIIGSAGFMGLQFKIHPGVLIPRPETETLVEEAMMFCSLHKGQEDIKILDIGTGSGSIAISLAKYVKNASVIGIDSDPLAVANAKENVRLHGVEGKVDMYVCDMLLDPFFTLGRFHLVVSNPPYIAEEEWELLQPEITGYEPKSALIAGERGLFFYRMLAERVPFVLEAGGFLMMETGEGQMPDVMKIFKDHGCADLSVRKDLDRRERVLKVRCTPYFMQGVGT